MRKQSVSGTPREMKRMNQRLILQTIRRKQPISRTEISEMTSISRTTVSQLIDEMMEEGVVRETGRGSSPTQGGRKPVFLSIDDDSGFVCGLDIGGSSITFVVCNLSGKVVSKEVVSTPVSLGLESLFRLIERFLDNAPVPVERLIGLGVGAPGITRFHDGVVLSAPSLGWTDLPLKEEMEDRFNLPVYVENDVNMAALGECWLGAGKGKRHVVMITVGTGIGCGLILNGDLYRGSRWASGEIGFMVTDSHAVEHWDDPVFSGFGYMESKAGGPAIARQYLRGLKDTDGTLVSNAKDIFDLWRKGDETAGAVIWEANKHLAAGIVNVVVLFDPEVVILGGGLMKSQDLLLPQILKTVKRFAPIQPEIRISQLGDDAGALGAGALVLKEHDCPYQGVL
ncbi:glucokinase-like ROK family protein [Melghirimyces profundicolus]|uniref:Glucokinase-like ROK family protein n=1 Tax=Melghirimyces profundicolus TaxID=1242148 RepID=A0A2T6C8I6_9BACL|nr:ROK family transcriptional regulator [Melghirimyces profundicolus]PTX64622.1 glucokinase-like ROK family protein [Melghirimyces profundicolus]